MSVERRDLVDFGERHFHLGGKRSKMWSRQVSVLILNEVQMLDQEIAPARPFGQERTHFYQRLRIDLTALWRARRATPASPPGAWSFGGQLLSETHLTPSKLQKNATESGPASPSRKSSDRYFRSISFLSLYFPMMWF